MIDFNLHTHCNYCDGKTNMETYVKQAINIGFSSLGFSSHAPWPFSNKWAMQANLLETYFNEILELQYKYANQIDIYTGLEIDFINQFTSPSKLKNHHQIDYLIGSVHFIYLKNFNTFLEIDGSRKKFIKACETVGVMQLVETYYSAIRKMVANETIDIIGHLDKIKIQNKKNLLFDEKEDWYVAQIDRTLDVIKKSSKIVEINTRGLYKELTTEPYPSWWIIEKIIEKGIPITVSSDTHHPKELSVGFKKISKKLKKLNCNEIITYKKGAWVTQAI